MTDYKFSKYNSILKTDAKLNVLYNGLSDRFIVFRKKLRALLDKDIEEYIGRILSYISRS